MRRSTQKLAPFFVVLMAALLAFPSLFSLQSNPVSAYVQNRAKSDVTAKPKQKRPRPHAVNGAAAPANDNCANAIAIATCPFTDTKDTTSATDETGEPASTCTDQGSSVWYTYVNNSANTVVVTVSTCNSDFDTAISVWQPTGAACDFANFAPIACNDDSDCGDGLQSQASFDAAPGGTYKIQVGGFDGETGNLTVDVSCVELVCDDIVVNGTLGTGSPNWPSVSGQQTPARLFRDGIPSSCGSPKTCPGPFGSGSFTFDAYTFSNDSGEDQCVTVLYDPNSPTGNCNVNAHAIAYLNTFSPTNLCLNYLADVGSSDELPFSFTVPSGADFVVVIAANNPGGVGNGCGYKFTVRGNICQGFDACIQNDRNASQFVLFNSQNGDYEYHDCSKGIVLSGTGVITRGVPDGNCKLILSDSGPDPKRPDRAIFLEYNFCTHVASASIRFPRTAKTPTNFNDSNTANNNCVCR